MISSNVTADLTELINQNLDHLPFENKEELKITIKALEIITAGYPQIIHTHEYTKLLDEQLPASSPLRDHLFSVLEKLTDPSDYAHPEHVAHAQTVFKERIIKKIQELEIKTEEELAHIIQENKERIEKAKESHAKIRQAQRPPIGILPVIDDPFSPFRQVQFADYYALMRRYCRLEANTLPEAGVFFQNLHNLLVANNFNQAVALFIQEGNLYAEEQRLAIHIYNRASIQSCFNEMYRLLFYINLPEEDLQNCYHDLIYKAVRSDNRILAKEIHRLLNRDERYSETVSMCFQACYINNNWQEAEYWENSLPDSRFKDAAIYRLALHYMATRQFDRAKAIVNRMGNFALEDKLYLLSLLSHLRPASFRLFCFSLTSLIVGMIMLMTSLERSQARP